MHTSQHARAFTHDMHTVEVTAGVWPGALVADETGAAGDLPSTVAGARWAFSVRPVSGWGAPQEQQRATAGWLAALPVFEPHWQARVAAQAPRDAWPSPRVPLGWLEHSAQCLVLQGCRGVQELVHKARMLNKALATGRRSKNSLADATQRSPTGSARPCYALLLHIQAATCGRAVRRS